MSISTYVPELRLASESKTVLVSNHARASLGSQLLAAVHCLDAARESGGHVNLETSCLADHLAWWSAGKQPPEDPSDYSRVTWPQRVFLAPLARGANRDTWP